MINQEIYIKYVNFYKPKANVASCHIYITFVTKSHSITKVVGVANVWRNVGQHDQPTKKILDYR